LQEVLDAFVAVQENIAPALVVEPEGTDTSVTFGDSMADAELTTSQVVEALAEPERLAALTTSV
jgi:hypothetical protein